MIRVVTIDDEPLALRVGHEVDGPGDDILNVHNALVAEQRPPLHQLGVDLVAGADDLRPFGFAVAIV